MQQTKENGGARRRSQGDTEGTHSSQAARPVAMQLGSTRLVMAGGLGGRSLSVTLGQSSVPAVPVLGLLKR